MKRYKSDEILQLYHDECELISDGCVAEGYPSHGSNYELRCEQLWGDYYAEEYNTAVDEEETD